jgi:hypothetical protein
MLKVTRESETGVLALKTTESVPLEEEAAGGTTLRPDMKAEPEDTALM